MHPLPNSKSSSSTATERKNNTRSTWPRWIQTGSRFLSNCKAPLRSSKTLHKLPTSPVSPSSTRASPPMSAKFKISNQSSIYPKTPKPLLLFCVQSFVLRFDLIASDVNQCDSLIFKSRSFGCKSRLIGCKT